MIPERWAEEYRAVTNCEHISYRRQSHIIEDLGDAESNLLKYGDHLKSCTKRRYDLLKCDCGWDENRAALSKQEPK